MTSIKQLIKQLKPQKSQKIILLMQHLAQNVNVLRSNIIFCDFCGFSRLMEVITLTTSNTRAQLPPS